MKSSPVAVLALTAGIFVTIPTAFGQTQADKQFLTHAMQGDMAEVQVGQLAQTKGNTDGVRKFGAMLMTDHTKAGEEAKKVADSLGVPAPAAPKPRAKQEYDKLSNLKGAAFDAEFLRAMVEDHEMDIAAFKKEAKSGGGATAKMASEQLPTLEKHLTTAQALRKQAAD